MGVRGAPGGGQTLGFRVPGFGFMVYGFVRVSGFGLRISDYRFRMYGSYFRASGWGWGVSGRASRKTDS